MAHRGGPSGGNVGCAPRAAPSSRSGDGSAAGLGARVAGSPASASETNAAQWAGGQLRRTVRDPGDHLPGVSRTTRNPVRKLQAVAALPAPSGRDGKRERFIPRYGPSPKSEVAYQSPPSWSRSQSYPPYVPASGAPRTSRLRQATPAASHGSKRVPWTRWYWTMGPTATALAEQSPQLSAPAKESQSTASPTATCRESPQASWPCNERL